MCSWFPETLLAGESMTCTGSGTAVKGQYRNVGAVTGTTVSVDDGQGGR